jgi:hypothetical protein
MGRECGTHGRGENPKHGFGCKTLRGRLLGGPWLRYGIILKWMLKVYGARI